jgi:hypothetical protein
MSFIKTPAHQARVVIVGMGLMSLCLMAVSLCGTPILHVTEGRHHDVFDLGSYIFPVLAAVSAGAGLFIHYPGVAASQGPPGALSEVQERNGNAAAATNGSSPAAPGDADLKAFYILSLVLLLFGLFCYAFCHPCQSANIVVISLFYLAIGTLILRARVATASANDKHGVFGRRVVSMLTVASVISFAAGICFFHVLFVAGTCVD